MSRKKFIKPIFIVFLVILMGAVYVLFCLWYAFGGGFYFTPNPPKPEIKYGEFPFSMEYEINGEQYSVEDTIVCEFDGYTVDEWSGKYRSWKACMKNSGDKIVLYKDNDIEIFYSPCFKSAKTGAAYMGDNVVYGNADESYFSHPFPNAYYILPDSKRAEIIASDELYEKYNIRLTKIETAKPIVNSFKKSFLQELFQAEN